jgi:hypothetical protein
MARTLTTMAKTPGKSAISGARLDSAAERLQAASAPLLLNPEERSAVSGAGSR